MSRVLGIDCSTAEMGLGVYDGDRAVCALSRYGPGSHAEHLAAAVDAVLALADTAPRDIGRIGVAVGPGSFTGLRIAIAFVKGFCFGHDTPVLPLSSLQVLACAWRPTAPRVVTAFDARRGEVFWARFERHEGEMVRMTEDAVCTGADFAEAIVGDSDTVITDTLGYARSTVFQGLHDRRNVYAAQRYPCTRGLACARLAAAEPPESAGWTVAAQIEPRYLRVSYAEERKAAQTGGKKAGA